MRINPACRKSRGGPAGGRRMLTHRHSAGARGRALDLPLGQERRLARRVLPRADGEGIQRSCLHHRQGWPGKLPSATPLSCLLLLPPVVILEPHTCHAPDFPPQASIPAPPTPPPHFSQTQQLVGAHRETRDFQGKPGSEHSVQRHVRSQIFHDKWSYPLYRGISLRRRRTP